ncbi:hypothetical protein MX850_10500 [Erysipelothrix sp. Poltava]|nr:hypothetical protein MX850_10500 [Erysipelothrix sp. Poltava]
MKKTLTILVILINLFGCQFVSSPSNDGTNKDFESALDTNFSVNDWINRPIK